MEGLLKLWTAWLQGRDVAPEAVRKIFHLWETLNPDYEVRVLEQKDTQQILERLGVNNQPLTPQVQTNFVRLYVLKKYGGVWADSTLLPTVPLGSWLPEKISQSGVFAFRSTGDPNLILQNWFIAAEAENPIICAWLDKYTEYFSTTRLFPRKRNIVTNFAYFDYLRYLRAMEKENKLWFIDKDKGANCRFYPYAAMNYCLAYILKNNTELQEVWKKVPTRFHPICTYLGELYRDQDTPDETLFEVAKSILPLAPLHKLNHSDKRWIKVLTHAETMFESGHKMTLEF